jgi:sulfur-carrier protein
MTSNIIRVIIPYHLQTLANVDSELSVELGAPVTIESLLDAIEVRYPMLRGTIREHVTKRRRPLVRFFACERDLSHEPTTTELPEAIVTGREPFIIWGAIAGG